LTEPFGSISIDILPSITYFKIELNGSVIIFESPCKARTGRYAEPADRGDERPMTSVESVGALHSGRTAAGQDNRKRRQILDGAHRLFMRQGFDATSMGDIATESGVSKGTLYVYFDSKERLFQELVREEKERQFPTIFSVDPDEKDVRAALTRVGRQFARFITAPHVVMAMRTIIAMAERMPDIALDFYDHGPKQCVGLLVRYFEAQIAAGVLAIPDIDLAASQFLDLTQTRLSRPLMFGAHEQPSEEQIDAVVEAAVDMFLAAYQRPPAGD
jgi:AcrR family transcriptional regulator